MASARAFFRTARSAACLARTPAGVAVCLALGVTAPAHAERIENEVAVFAALDKVTARINRLEVPLNQTAKFGSLKVTPRACYSRPPTEPPKTSTFVEVSETAIDGKEKRVFSGWMFAESPGLHAVEHPVFDVWLTDCTKPQHQVAAQKGPPTAKGAAAPTDETPEPRRRVRR